MLLGDPHVVVKEYSLQMLIERRGAALPSNTNLLLTKNYSEILISGKITNLTRNSLKMSFFPGHFESTKPLKNYKKQVSESYFRNNFVSEGL